jgi:hypothetical protein
LNKTNIVFLLAALALFFIVIPNSGENKVGQRKIYWEQKLEKEIPSDSSRESVILWAKQKKVEYTTPDETHMSISIDRISGWGFTNLYCSDWDVFIDVTFNSFDEVTAKTVRKVSTCM